MGTLTPESRHVFRRFVVYFIGLVCLALGANFIEQWVLQRETRLTLDRWITSIIVEENSLASENEGRPAGGAVTLIREYGCLSCHKLDGIGASVGPVLNGVRTRKTREEMVTWIRDPKAIKSGTKMPRFPFSEAEIRTIVDYLMTK